MSTTPDTSTAPQSRFVTPEEIALLCEHARPMGNGFLCSCPLHTDQHPSLKVSYGDKATVLWCHAGCSTPDVLLALNLTPESLFYDYDPSGGGSPVLAMRNELAAIKRTLNPPPPLPVTIFGLMEEAFSLPQPWHTKGLSNVYDNCDEILGESPARALRMRQITRDTVVYRYFQPWCENEGYTGAKLMQFAEWGMKKLQEFWIERKREWS